MSEHERDDQMRDDQQLGDALREQLQALVADVNPSAALTERIDAIPSTRSSAWQRVLDRVRRRRFLIAVPVPLAAIAATLVVVLSESPAPTTADGITRLPNGNIRVTVNQMLDIAGTNAELRHFGVHSIVLVPFTASCPRDPSMTYIDTELYPAPQMTLTPKTLAPGWTTIMATRIIGKNLVQQAVDRFRTGHVPNCVSTHAVNVVGAPPPAPKRGSGGGSKKSSH